MAGKEEILINITSRESRAAIVENGIVQEIHLERSLLRGVVGNIYKGKVTRVLPGMQAAFIDIGLEQNGFLHAADVIVANTSGTSGEGAAVRQKSKSNTPLIQNLVHAGESLWVQVAKDPTSSKGARLTTELSLPSRNLVYLPLSTGIAISQKIKSVDARTRLMSLLEKLLGSEAWQGGFIVRTLAESAADQELENDIAYLQRLWEQIGETMRSAPPASLVHRELPLALRVLRDLVTDELAVIRIDSKHHVNQAIQFAEDLMPELTGKIKLHAGETALFDLYSIEQEIEKALQAKVMLNSGGDLVIVQTEAMATIDVNTGSYVGQADHQATLLQTNTEAAIEIARQLRLRNLSGIIIIDFIDMLERRHRSQVMQTLEAALANDRVNTQITPMSPLGLVAVTRQKTRLSLEQLMCDSCSVCEGRGTVKTGQTICYEIMRELLSTHRNSGARGYTIIACPEVVDLFRDKEAASLSELQDFIARPIELRPDDHYPQQRYDIVLN